MSFGGLIDDPLRGAVQHHGQLLMPEQIELVEQTDELLRLRARVQGLQRDKELLEQQLDLAEDGIPDVIAPTADPNLSAERVAALEQAQVRLTAELFQSQERVAQQTNQLGRINAVNRTQQARLLELNRRLGIGQPRQPERMTITQNRVNQYFNALGGVLQARGPQP